MKKMLIYMLFLVMGMAMISCGKEEEPENTYLRSWTTTPVLQVGELGRIFYESNCDAVYLNDIKLPKSSDGSINVEPIKDSTFNLVGVRGSQLYESSVFIKVNPTNSSVEVIITTDSHVEYEQKTIVHIKTKGIERVISSDLEGVRAYPPSGDYSTPTLSESTTYHFTFSTYEGDLIYDSVFIEVAPPPTIYTDFASGIWKPKKEFKSYSLDGPWIDTRKDFSITCVGDDELSFSLNPRIYTSDLKSMCDGSTFPVATGSWNITNGNILEAFSPPNRVESHSPAELKLIQQGTEYTADSTAIFYTMTVYEH